MPLLLDSGMISGITSERSDFFSLPEAFTPFIPPVSRVNQWDRPVAPLVVDSEGICYLVLLKDVRSPSKYRKDEFDGLQLLVDAVWKEGLSDLFEFPKFCAIDFLCFRTIAAPLERWFQDESGYLPFVTHAVWSDPSELSKWEQANPEAAQALAELAKHIPGCAKYPFPTEGDFFAILLAENKQKMALSCPLGFQTRSFNPSEASVSEIVNIMSNFDNPVTSPLVFRALLREKGFRVRHIGRILEGLNIPILKELVVKEMIGRSAKWHVRKLLGQAFAEGTLTLSPPGVKVLLADAEIEQLLIEDASRYFEVPATEIVPFLTVLNPFTARFSSSIFSWCIENRTLFPHEQLLGIPKSLGYFPTTKFVAPRPAPVVVKPEETSPMDALPLSYAARLFELEMAMASGDFSKAVVTIGELVHVIIRMRLLESSEVIKEQMRVKALALCEAGRGMVHQDLIVPPLITHAILECFPSVSVFSELRREIILVEGENSVSLLALDSVMARHVFESDPAQAIRFLSHVAERAEKWLGAAHPVTTASWVRKAQAIKRVIERQVKESRSPFSPVDLQDGIKCLNRAIKASALSKIPRPHTNAALDEVSLSYHMLAIFHMWNGQPGKAVETSREGLAQLVIAAGGRIHHPRYLNCAFLHAKLLEMFAASVRETAPALQAAREAVDLLERILDSLEDLSSNCESDTDVVQELIQIFGHDFIDTENEMKRKLAITALLLKLNVWLLDPCTAADLLDLVVADQISGTKGVLVLPHRAAVKEAVSRSLKNKLDQGDEKSRSNIPILEFSSSLPESVMLCCKRALIAKSKGTSVSNWFKTFREETVRTMGETENSFSVQNKQILTSLFLAFVFVSTADEVYVGPLANPLIPRKLPPVKEAKSQGVIYRDWERSAVLYSIDHAINPLLDPINN